MDFELVKRMFWADRDTFIGVISVQQIPVFGSFSLKNGPETNFRYHLQTLL